MDVIIDDGPHTFNSQELFLKVYWPFVKPGHIQYLNNVDKIKIVFDKRLNFGTGGYYFIEDVDMQRGGEKFKLNHELLADFTKSVFHENHVMFIDHSVGHR